MKLKYMYLVDLESEMLYPKIQPQRGSFPAGSFSRPGKDVQEQHYFSIHPSFCSSHYLLLNHWAEFKQTCYMNSCHGKGVHKQVCPSVHPSFLHAISKISTEGDYAMACH